MCVRGESGVTIYVSVVTCQTKVCSITKQSKDGSKHFLSGMGLCLSSTNVSGQQTCLYLHYLQRRVYTSIYTPGEIRRVILVAFKEN